MTTTEIKTITKVDENIEKANQPKIILYNDNVNSFDHVIINLVTYCGHNLLQAEQCATIVHTKGKYAVKHGSIDELIDICSILSSNNLTVEIQS